MCYCYNTHRVALLLLLFGTLVALNALRHNVELVAALAWLVVAVVVVCGLFDAGLASAWLRRRAFQPLRVVYSVCDMV